MSAQPKSARAFAAAFLLACPSAMAADLDGYGYSEAPYSDEQYSEGFEAGGPGYGDEHGEYREPGPQPEPPARYGYDGSLKDGYPVPQGPPPRRYIGERAAPDRGCVPHWEVRRRLRAGGWSDIRPIAERGAFAVLRARRYDSGRVFTLKVDRCWGEIVAARPHYLRTFGAYPPQRWRRAY